VTDVPDATGRSEVLAQGLARTHERIETACRAAGRDRGEVHLIVVTKTWPVSDIVCLADLGVRDVGENKSAELVGKRQDRSVADAGLTWHFIGQIQSNKARRIAQFADVVHGVDRAKLVEPLARGVHDRPDEHAGGDLGCLVQVSLDPTPVPGRGGASAQEALVLADLIAHTDGLQVRGVMGVAPPTGDPRAAFARLREVADDVVAAHPSATWISAGMSDDLEAAVEAGATHLRVGSAILGSRPRLG
jgi:pyridoxal phosphate enzyme (YggS family)